MRVTPGHTSALENALILSHVYKPSSFDTSEATRPLSMDSQNSSSLNKTSTKNERRNKHLTLKSFNFIMLGDDKLKAANAILEEKETIESEEEINLSNRVKRPKTREKVFIVNKKNKSNVVNQRSCYSKQTILLSHGDQYREIYEFTRKINNSLRNTQVAPSPRN